jgi:phenylalanyl-tRNA synthetase beta chain
VKILLSWLREFVDVPGSAEELARTLSVRGFAVESIDACGDGDAVLDFEVTANRPDCMSVVGIAREAATAYGLPLNMAPRIPDPGSKTGPPSPVGGSRGGPADIDIVIEDTSLCPRYAGAIADVQVGPSPPWMQARLQAAGIRPISNIVDVTNYVLVELGQPMHAFDLAKLAGPQIRVRPARAGERIRTLDGQTRDLSPAMLVIADAEKPAAVAGVMGGADSEVSQATTAIVLESAYFDPLSVRRTSKKLGLKTEASMRFERGADPNLAATAMTRAMALLASIGAGQPRGNTVDRYPAAIAPRIVRLRPARIAGLLGAAVPHADVRRILEALGFTMREAADGWDVEVPTRRVDAIREVDLIEEIARHYGFDRLPVTFPALANAPRPMDPRVIRARQLRASLTGAGFSEAVTFGFIAQPAAAPFAAPDDIVPIANPLSETFAVLRPSALPGLMDAVAHNRRRERRDVRLFEIGAGFSRAQGERRALACAWTGAAGADHWSGGARDVDFFDMKGIVERVCEVASVTVEMTPKAISWLVPGRSAVATAGGTRVAVLGQLAREITDAHGLAADPVYVADVDLDALDRLGAGRQLRVERLPRYPSVTRDISVLIGDAVAAAAVRSTIRSAAPATLVQVIEFDRYQGKGVPEGHVSLSLRLTFRSSDRTLTDSEVQAAMDDVVAALKDRHGAAQR